MSAILSRSRSRSPRRDGAFGQVADIPSLPVTLLNAGGSHNYDLSLRIAAAVENLDTAMAAGLSNVREVDAISSISSASLPIGCDYLKYTALKKSKYPFRPYLGFKNHITGAILSGRWFMANTLPLRVDPRIDPSIHAMIRAMSRSQDLMKPTPLCATSAAVFGRPEICQDASKAMRGLRGSVARQDKAIWIYLADLEPIEGVCGLGYGITFGQDGKCSAYEPGTAAGCTVALGSYDPGAIFSVEVNDTGHVDVRVAGMQWTSQRKPPRPLEATVMLFHQGDALLDFAPIRWPALQPSTEAEL